MNEVIETTDVSTLNDTELKEALNTAKSQIGQSQTGDYNPSDNKVDNVIPKSEPEKEKEEDIDQFVFDDKPYRQNGFNDSQIEIIKKKDKQIWHEQKMIQRQAQEVANARKRELEISNREKELNERLSLAEQKREQLKDDFYSDPEAYEQSVIENHSLAREKEQLRLDRLAYENQKIVLNAVPDINNLMPDIESVIKEDAEKFGTTHLVDDAINGIKQGKWVYENPTMIINIASRAKLLKQNREYEQKIKDMSVSPDLIGKKLAQVANQRPVITGNYVSEKKSYSHDDIISMSDAELKEALKRARENSEI